MINLRHFLASIMAPLLPAMVFAISVLYYLNLKEKDDAQFALGNTAISTIAALDRGLQSEIAALLTLSAAISLDDADLSSFLDLARRVLPNHNGWLSVVITDEHQLLASTSTGVTTPPRPLLEPRNASKVFRNECPCVSGVYPANERTYEPYYVISVPVIRNGAVKYTASAVVRAWSLHQLLSQLPIPEGGRIGLLDREGKIVARSNSTEPMDKLVSGFPSQSVLDGLKRQDALFQATPIDGDPLYMAARRHELSGWSALASAPVAVLDAPRLHMLVLASGGGGIALLLTLTVGVAMARSSARRMAAERRVADLEVEAEKRKGEHQFRTLADSIPQLAWMADAEGKIFWYNKRWYDYTGTTPDQMREDGWRAVLHPNHVEQILRELRVNWAAGAAWEGSHLLCSSHGEWRWFLTRAEPIFDEAGRLVRWFGTNTDITEQHRTEAALQAAKEEAERANLSKSKFLAAASHDIRQPVQSLFFMLAALEGQTTSGGTKILSHANSSLVSLKELLDSLMDISQYDAGMTKVNIKDFPLTDILEQIDAEYKHLADAKGLRWQLLPTTAMVRSDPVLLGRMLRNICQNALKFTKSGGVKLCCRHVDNMLHIEVEDSGIGIPEDKQEEIFEEFYQIANEHRDRRQGLGLGLAIVQRLSKLLDHPVSIRSATGRGSTFTVAVPIVAQSAPRPRTTEGSFAGPGDGEFVVVIEDEDLVRLGVRTLILSWGYDVLDAVSGPKALEELRKTSRLPHLIISDYRLPEGMNGIKTISTIRSLYGAAIPAILLTGEAARECAHEAAAEDITLLQKPVSPSQLQAMFRAKTGRQ